MIVSGGVKTNGRLNGSVEKAKSIIVKEVEFNNRSEFPSKGYAKYLYIALDENKIYRWDDNDLYVPLCSEIDDENTSLSSTWSSEKINIEITNVVDNMECATTEDIQNLF